MRRADRDQRRPTRRLKNARQIQKAGSNRFISRAFFRSADARPIQPAESDITVATVRQCFMPSTIQLVITPAPPRFVILAIGVRHRRLASECSLTAGKLGGIYVDASMHASDPDIYAVGDAVKLMILLQVIQYLFHQVPPIVRSISRR